MPQKKKSTKVSRAKHPQPQFDFESDGWTDRYKNTIDEKTAKAISELVTDVGLKQVESAIATYRQQQDWETKQPRDSEVRAMLLYCKKVIEPMRELLLHPNNQKRKSLDEITKDHIANKISETYPDDSWGDTEKRLKKDLQKLWESCELLLEH